MFTKSTIDKILPISTSLISETKRSLKREASDWIERCKFEDRNALGRALYHITSFQKIKRITIPVDAFHLLFVSVDNEPLSKSKTKQNEYLY